MHAALDVTDPEPLPAGHPLWSAPERPDHPARRRCDAGDVAAGAPARARAAREVRRRASRSQNVMTGSTSHRAMTSLSPLGSTVRDQRLRRWRWRDMARTVADGRARARGCGSALATTTARRWQVGRPAVRHAGGLLRRGSTRAATAAAAAAASRRRAGTGAAGGRLRRPRRDLGRTAPTAAIRFPEDTGASVERVWQLAARHRATRRGVGRHRAAARCSAPTDRGETFALTARCWDHPHRPEWGAGFGGQAIHTRAAAPHRPRLGDRGDVDRRRLPHRRRRRLLGAAPTRASGPSSCPEGAAVPRVRPVRAQGRPRTRATPTGCSRRTTAASTAPTTRAAPGSRSPTGCPPTSASRSWSHPHDPDTVCVFPLDGRRRPLPDRRRGARLAVHATPARPGRRWARRAQRAARRLLRRRDARRDVRRRPRRGRGSTSAPATAASSAASTRATTWRELVRAPARRARCVRAARGLRRPSVRRDGPGVASGHAQRLRRTTGTPDIKPRSRDVTDGLEKAAARGMLRAVGMGDDDWEKPQIGVASSWNEITPCNLSASTGWPRP